MNPRPEQSKATTSTTKELESIIHQLAEVTERTEKIYHGLKEPVRRISYIDEGPQDPNPERDVPRPDDVINRLRSILARANRTANGINGIVDHLNQII